MTWLTALHRPERANPRHALSASLPGTLAVLRADAAKQVDRDIAWRAATGSLLPAQRRLRMVSVACTGDRVTKSTPMRAARASSSASWQDAASQRRPGTAASGARRRAAPPSGASRPPGSRPATPAGPLSISCALPGAQTLDIHGQVAVLRVEHVRRAQLDQARTGGQGGTHATQHLSGLQTFRSDQVGIGEARRRDDGLVGGGDGSRAVRARSPRPAVGLGAVRLAGEG